MTFFLYLALSLHLYHRVPVITHSTVHPEPVVHFRHIS